MQVVVVFTVPVDERVVTFLAEIVLEDFYD